MESSSYQKMMAAIGFAKWLAGTFTDAPHANDVSKKMNRTPADYGMDYENVAFPATDGCQIAAWYIPAKDKGSKKLAILAHQSWSYANKSGMPGLRMPMMPGLPGMVWQEGIDYVKLHKVLHDDGFHVLAYDLRNHGDSERRLPSGWGVTEFQDAAGAMDYVNSHSTLKHCSVTLLPFCVTGQATLKANALFPEKFTKVKAWVLTNLFTFTNMWLTSPAMNTLFCKGGGSLQYISEETLDAALKAKQAQYIASGQLKEDPNIDFCCKQLCATTYAPQVKVPVLYCTGWCTPINDFLPNQAMDAPEIFAAFPNFSCNEFHGIGTDQPEPYKTSTDNRSQGYNYYQSEAGSKVMLDFLHKHGL